MCSKTLSGTNLKWLTPDGIVLVSKEVLQMEVLGDVVDYKVDTAVVVSHRMAAAEKHFAAKR